MPERDPALAWAARIASACRVSQEVREFEPDLTVDRWMAARNVRTSQRSANESGSVTCGVAERDPDQGRQLTNVFTWPTLTSTIRAGGVARLPATADSLPHQH